MAAAVRVENARSEQMCGEFLSYFSLLIHSAAVTNQEPNTKTRRIGKGDPKHSSRLACLYPGCYVFFLSPQGRISAAVALRQLPSITNIAKSIEMRKPIFHYNGRSPIPLLCSHMDGFGRVNYSFSLLLW
jgi:hypothetical protein